MTLILDHDLVDAAQMTVNLTVHKDAVITGYSYWFKGEQVDAKLLDNDQAWEIYRTVTSRGRDPAIMEQWGETDYHFQIFPVEPKVPLKMVVHYLQPWESDEESFYYRPPFPVQADKLRHYDAQVRLPGMSGAGLWSNWTDGFTMESDGPVYRLEKSDWAPREDWRIRIGRHGKRLDALASGGRSGGKSGFFYVLMAPSRDLGPSKLRFSGVRTWDVMPRTNGGLKQGYPWLITGRYKGAGVLKVTLQPKRGRALTTAVRLTSAAMPNGAATKFWGTRAVKRAANATSVHYRTELSKTRRDEVVRLSQRFGVVSAYTAWLAIPKSELEFYKKLQDDPKFREEQNRLMLEKQQQSFKANQANQARTNAQAARGGDPLIRISTTPDIRKVTAVLPTGESIPLVRKPGGVWEARFDIPWGTAEGAYEVLVLLQSEDGSRKRVTLTYRIDRTPGTGDLTLEAGSLTVRASEDIERVTARLSNGERFELIRDGTTFTGRLPGNVSGRVEVTLIDRAHNITVLYADPR
jgi:hypothetical protein